MVVSCNKNVSNGSMPSLKRRIAPPQSPIPSPHNVVYVGVVIDASELSGEIQFIIHGWPFSVTLVFEENRRFDDVTLFTRDNKRCV